MTENFTTLTNTGITPDVYLTCMAAAIVCGILAAAASLVRNRPTKSFIFALLFLPPIVQTVITMVNGNLGTGVAVMGAFSLVRFRSVPGKAREIVCIFLSMTAGLACAAGYTVLAILFTAIISVGIVLISLIPTRSERELELHITVPESLAFHDAFDDLFKSYFRRVHLVSVKTTNMGSLFKLVYRVDMKDRSRSKELIDSLRCRNGNLEISLIEAQSPADEL